jgi:hypothetical protein
MPSYRGLPQLLQEKGCFSDARKGCPAAIVCHQGAAIGEQAELPVQAYLIVILHKQYVPRAPKTLESEGKADNVATCRITRCKAETKTVFKFKR